MKRPGRNTRLYFYSKSYGFTECARDEGICLSFFCEAIPRNKKASAASPPRRTQMSMLHILFFLIHFRIVQLNRFRLLKLHIQEFYGQREENREVNITFRNRANV